MVISAGLTDNIFIRPPVCLSATLKKPCQTWARVDSACPGTFLPQIPTFGCARLSKRGTSPMRLTNSLMRFAKYVKYSRMDSYET